MTPEQRAAKVVATFWRGFWPEDIPNIAPAIARALRAERRAALEEAAKFLDKHRGEIAPGDEARIVRSFKRPAARSEARKRA
jgi:hypothetical protein